MRFIAILAAGVLLVISCKQRTSLKNENRPVTIDSVYNARFFPRGDRFTGGDATYSVPLPDGRTVWIFGDSFLGNVTSDLRRIKTDPQYIRNCFVVLEKDSILTLQQGEPKEFKSMMIPPEVTVPGSKFTEHDFWYWPGDGFVEDGKLNVFVSKFFQKPQTDMWSFEFRGTELIEFSLPDFKTLQITRFPDIDSVHYGHAVLETPDYIYIYGLKKHVPYVARAVKGKVREPWKFYNGKDWVDFAKEGRPMIDFAGSEQFSVSEWKGTYIMIMQASDLSRKIYSFTSKTPFGPWENQQMVYETPIPENCKACWTYNAMAHPQFTKDDLLLISYNTNSMQMEDHYRDASLYRPRFIRVPMAQIIQK